MPVNANQRSDFRNKSAENPNDKLFHFSLWLRFDSRQGSLARRRVGTFSCHNSAFLSHPDTGATSAIATLVAFLLPPACDLEARKVGLGVSI